MEQKIKKPRLETGPLTTPPSAIPLSSTDMEDSYGSRQVHHGSATGKPSPSTTAFRVENWSAASPPHSAPTPRSVATDINISLPGG